MTIPICNYSLSRFNMNLFFVAQLPKVNYFYYVLYRFKQDADFVFEQHMRKHTKKKTTKTFYREFCKTAKDFKRIKEVHEKGCDGKEYALVRITFDKKEKWVTKIKVIDVFVNN